MEINNEVLDFIKKTARKYLPDADVMLFGSRARKDAGPESDFDILVITHLEIDPQRKLPIKTNIRKDLLKMGIRTDVLIQSRSEIRRKKNLPGHIIRNIFREAVSL